DGVALSRLRGPVRVHAQWMGGPRVRGRPETAHPVGRVAVHPGRPAPQRDEGVTRPGAAGDFRARGHGDGGLRSARGLVPARVTITTRPSANHEVYALARPLVY